MAGMDSYVIVILVLCALTALGNGDDAITKARSCSDIRKFYTGKGFGLDEVPLSEISGEHLRVCPQGYTCCTSAMEESLANLSRIETEHLLKISGHIQQATINAHYKAFDEFFMEALNRSEGSLQESFPSALGPLYTENAHVFRDLYTDLRRYFRGTSNINLEEALNEFWSRLLERLFKTVNRQYTIGDEYLECVSKNMERLRPFGGKPHALWTSVKSTFVSTRSFVQALMVGGEVMRKVSQLPMSAECTRAIMKMTYCPHCRGVASAKACPNYCLNVMKGCLANQADLHTEWRNLLDVLEQVLNHMEAQVNVETVILTLPARMAEAVSALRENMDALNPKVFRACGELREGGTSSGAQEEVKKGGKILVPDKVGLGNRAMLEKLVSGLRAWLNTAGQYWVTQPVKICQEMESFSVAVDEDKCWNGMTRGRYLPEMMGDGLASQINNPEVDIDITKPHMRVRQQIMELKMMTNRVKSAINGNDVEFQDTSDDVSGSGSGLCAEENCPRGPRLILPNTDSPRVYAFPPENNKVRATGSHNLPCSTLYLLSLVTPLLWR
ncbi:glypican-1-like [Osmerus mordax]|uniref:glypican-1-like n=1 Tax=Osmerus mordax TaxID=8014 RepID=UPI0035100337